MPCRPLSEGVDAPRPKAKGGEAATSGRAVVVIIARELPSNRYVRRIIQVIGSVALPRAWPGLGKEDDADDGGSQANPKPGRVQGREGTIGNDEPDSQDEQPIHFLKITPFHIDCGLT